MLPEDWLGTVLRNRTPQDLRVQFRLGTRGPESRGLVEELSRRRRLEPFLPTPNTDVENFRDQVISNYLATLEGRQQLAQSMIAPIRRNIDYQSVSRRTFLVDSLPEVALPIYDRNPNVGEVISSESWVTPDWLVPGVWIRIGGEQKTQIGQVESTEQGVLGTFLIVKLWRSAEVLKIHPKYYSVLEKIEEPPPPLSRFERMSGDLVEVPDGLTPPHREGGARFEKILTNFDE